MLKKSAAIALGLALATLTTSQAANARAPARHGAQSAAEREVRQFIYRYNGYYANNDLDRYFSSFDPQLTQWWPSGRVDLNTYQTMWRRLVARGGGTSKAVVSDLRVQVDASGDAAVATYILEVTPRENGRPGTAIERNQETDVLFKRGGQWKIVHVNYGPAKPRKP